MFVPPPIQLSIEQIEHEKKLRLEREAERKNAAAVAASTTDAPLQRVSTQDSRSSRKTGLFSRKRVSKDVSQLSKEKNKKKEDTEKQSVSSPVLTPPTRHAPKHQESAGERAERKGRDSVLSSPQSGKSPPPKRPARPPSELSPVLNYGRLSQQRVAASIGPASAALIELTRREGVLPPTSEPPPIPLKSPRRQTNTAIKSIQSTVLPVPQASQQPAENASNSQGWPLVSDKAEIRPTQPVRATTAPPDAPLTRLIDAAASNPKLGSPKRAERVNSSGSRPSSMEMIEKRLSGVQDGKIRKPVATTKRANTVPQFVPRSDKATNILGLESRLSESGNEPNGSTKKKALSTTGLSPIEMQLPWRRRRKGETMSMLMSSGFFLQDVLAYDRMQEIQSGEKPSKHSSPSSILEFMIDRDLPDTPGSMIKTPTEMYAGGRSSLVDLPLVVKKEHPVKRGARRQVSQKSPLSQASGMTDSRNVLQNQANKTLSSATGLSAIPELFTSTSLPEIAELPASTNTPVLARDNSEETAAPVKTQYEPPTYLEGPIRLSGSSVVQMRSNSIASLEPFQSAVDEVYQNAISVSRQNVEEKLVDDICQWFDGFGFVEKLTFAGDAFDGDASDDADREELKEPPTEIVHRNDQTWLDDKHKSTQSVSSKDSIAPADTAEGLRAKGIARLSGHGRKESSTLAKLERAATPPTAAQEKEALHAAERTSEEKKHVARDSGLGEQGFDWDDDVVEIVNEGNRRTSGFSRNPMTKFRRLTGMVVTAWSDDLS